MIYDISPVVTTGLAVWPGDTAPSREVLLDLHKGDHLTLSTLHATVHLGAHTDAPSHYDPDGLDMGKVPLEPYLGPCRVIEVAPRPGERVVPADLPDGRLPGRVLFRTDSYPDPDSFNEDFMALSPELVHHLKGAGVLLAGIDTPSIDPFTSKNLESHKACAATGLLILEGVVLGHVPAGDYELIALPLKLDQFDASPVRAVLRTLERPAREEGR
jgi:arylformamidase